MAFTKCPECGGRVSNKAECCPHCGFVLKPKSDWSDYWASYLVISVVGLVILLLMKSR